VQPGFVSFPPSLMHSWPPCKATRSNAKRRAMRRAVVQMAEGVPNLAGQFLTGDARG
jgi:hypothetical protein